MPFDEHLADRVRARLDTTEGVTEKRMFGGLGFMVDGKMAVAANSKGALMVRVPPEETASLLAEPGAEPMEMRGRELNGWLVVSSEAVEDEGALGAWVDRGVEYARSLA